MRIPLRLIWALAAISPLSCTGTDVGNPVVDIDFAVYDSDPPDSSARVQLAVAPAGLVVDKAWVVVERIRLRAAADCEGGAQDEFVGPFAVDMLAPGAPPALSGLEVSASSYCRIELRWDALGDGDLSDVPAELVEASILLEGRRADSTRFVVRSRRGDELRLDARAAAFTIDDLTSALFVAFDVQDLFDGVDIDAAEIGEDNTIRLEQGSNEEMLAIFDDNLADAARLFGDDDGNGELDLEERDDDADILAE